MKKFLALLVSLTSLPLHAEHLENIVLDDVDVAASLLDSNVLKHPATVETYDKTQIRDSINAATSAQTLKYLPSLQVRERYIGDRNGILAARTIGTLSSAQSMVYADGILLSNLLGNSFAFPPRWGMVSPEEIESISMMYGPFSALYAGNSFGGVVSIATRMPERFEAHASAQAFQQDFELYGTDASYQGHHATASLGDKSGDFSYWLGVDRLENEGQPMNFSTARRSATAPGGSPVVTGAFHDKSETGADRVIFGANSIDTTEQTQLKFKAAYDITSNLRASYMLGVWDLESRTDVESYVRDSAGNPVYNGRVNFDGARYDISGMNPGKSEAVHIMHAFDLKSHSGGFYDWQLTLSDYDYRKDRTSSANPSASGSLVAGNPYLTRAGRVTDLHGTGWTVLDARLTLRPEAHTVDLGYHIDDYELRSTTRNTADWTTAQQGALSAAGQGRSRTQAVYGQDKWQLSPQWALTYGLRAEHWRAFDGSNQTTIANALTTADYADASATRVSPKIALSFEPEPAWGFRAALGQAYRFPTVSELYQPLQNGAVSYFVQSNPHLKPEQVIAAEFSAERRFAQGIVRATLFHENKYDALISQTLPSGSAIPYDTGTCTRAAGCGFVQNVDHVRTRGIELSTQWQDVLVPGLDLLANVTLTDAEVLRNRAAPATEGNKPPRIPRSMLKLVATYHSGPDITYSLAARYSGRQYNALDNSDVNPDTFGGASRMFVMDARATYRFADRWTAAIGVDNLNNEKAYVFHPYPQRTAFIQLKFDY